MRDALDLDVDDAEELLGDSVPLLAMLQPCPEGRGKWDDGRVITIGQLAK